MLLASVLGILPNVFNVIINMALNRRFFKEFKIAFLCVNPRQSQCNERLHSPSFRQNSNDISSGNRREITELHILSIKCNNNSIYLACLQD